MLRVRYRIAAGDVRHESGRRQWHARLGCLEIAGEGLGAGAAAGHQAMTPGDQKQVSSPMAPMAFQLIVLWIIAAWRGVRA
jgi:hypothetical protein